MRSLSKLIFKTFESDINFKFLGRKINKKWEWTDRKQLYYNVLDCREMLKNYNVKKGDRVAYKGDNSLEWISWNIASNSMGAIWVPMYGSQNLDYCKHIVSDCKPKVLITDENLDLETLVVSNQIAGYKNDLDIDFVDNEISTLIYTSGTTGKPKGVMLSNENIITNIDGIRSRFKDIGPITSLNILPWAHIYSQTCELYYNLLFDNKMALASSRENFVKECGEIKPHTLYLVPRVLELVKSKLEFFDKPLIRYLLPLLLNRLFGGNLINIFTGGAKLDVSTRNFFLQNGINVCEGYGCSETSPMVSVNHLIEPRDVNSIGKLLDDVLVEIVNDEIQVSGPNIMLGYWNNKEATEKVLIKRDDKIWYKTGDSGYLKDNFLYYEGRISENYKLSNGKFVNVPEVESKIKVNLSGSFIIFGDGENYNSMISDVEVSDDMLNLINSDIEPHLRIKKVYTISSEEWSQFLTPKMSLKRKLLVEYVKEKLNI